MDVKNNIKVVILVLNNCPYMENFNIYGKNPQEFLKGRFKNFNVEIIDIEEDYNGFDFSNLTSYVVNDDNQNQPDLLVATTSNSLFITESDIEDIISEFNLLDVNIAKIEKTLVAKSRYLKRIDKIYAPKLLRHTNFNFEVVNSFDDMIKLHDIVKRETLFSHLDNGVIINLEDVSSISIEPGIKIGAGTTLEGAIRIKGDSYIGSNVKIKGNCNINNSFILDDCVINNSNISDSILKNGVKIGDYSNIKNKTVIEAKASIEGNTTITKSKIKEEEKIPSFKHIGSKE